MLHLGSKAIDQFVNIRLGEVLSPHLEDHSIGFYGSLKRGARGRAWCRRGLGSAGFGVWAQTTPAISAVIKKATSNFIVRRKHDRFMSLSPFNCKFCRPQNPSIVSQFVLFVRQPPHCLARQ